MDNSFIDKNGLDHDNRKRLGKYRFNIINVMPDKGASK